MTWEKDGTHWPDDVRNVDEVEQVEKQPPAPTRHEWTDVGIHHVKYCDAKGRLHREDGPAVTDTWPDGYHHEAWYWRDKRHRKDGPALVSTFPNGAQGKEWWENGKFIRRERTPAPKVAQHAHAAPATMPDVDEVPPINVPGYNGPERRKTKRLLRALRRRGEPYTMWGGNAERTEGYCAVWVFESGIFTCTGLDAAERAEANGFADRVQRGDTKTEG